MSKTFCALPWQHLCFGSEGTARLCCITDDVITEHGAPMSLYAHSATQMWNSTYMRDVRQKMLRGEPLAQCEKCYASEAASGQSYRTSTGLQPLAYERLDVEAVKESGRSNGYRAMQGPSFIKLELGNLCNLKCRMCFGSLSSQIERDPVHNLWTNSGDPLNSVWRGDSARIGPEPKIGVRVSGFHPVEFADGKPFRWTDGHATLSMPMAKSSPVSVMEVDFLQQAGPAREFQIVVNGTPVWTGASGEAPLSAHVDLAAFAAASELVVEIISDADGSGSAPKESGIPVSGIRLRRDQAIGDVAHPQLVTSRFSDQKPWHESDDIIFGEVLKKPEDLRRLYITGGEPLINHRTAEIIKYLIDRKASGNIEVEFSTNCTHVDRDFLQSLRNFRHAQFFLSLDSVGATYEYIRYPARWETIDRNVRILKSEFNFRCFAVPVVQIYNLFNLLDVLEYSEAVGLEFGLNILHTPEHLAIKNLPPITRKAAAAKLLDYAAKHGRSEHIVHIVSLGQYLESLQGPGDAEQLREFMVFTNDLDASRGQSIKNALPDLCQMLEDDGYPWINDTRYSGTDLRSTPARERLYAWV